MPRDVTRSLSGDYRKTWRSDSDWSGKSLVRLPPRAMTLEFRPDLEGSFSRGELPLYHVESSDLAFRRNAVSKPLRMNYLSLPRQHIVS